MVTRLTYKSILDTIGNTPIVELQRMSPKESVRIFAKLEGQNPTGSVKDRIALKMIEKAERDGQISTTRTLLAPPSGVPVSAALRLMSAASARTSVRVTPAWIRNPPIATPPTKRSNTRHPRAPVGRS